MPNMIIEEKPPTATSADRIYWHFRGDITLEEAKVVRKVMKGLMDPFDVEVDGRLIDRANHGWEVKQPPYRYYSWTEMAMQAISVIINACGVEAIFGFTGEAHCVYRDTAFLYVNTGRMYGATILYVPYKDRFVLSSQGDLMEDMKQKKLISEEKSDY